jgi:hypothetical protein
MHRGDHGQHHSESCIPPELKASSRIGTEEMNTPAPAPDGEKDDGRKQENGVHASIHKPGGQDRIDAGDHQLGLEGLTTTRANWTTDSAVSHRCNAAGSCAGHQPGAQVGIIHQDEKAEQDAEKE